MNLLPRIWAAMKDQRGQFDFGALADSLGLGQDVSSYLPSGGDQFTGLNLSPGMAESIGPMGGGGGFGDLAQGILGDIGGFAKQALPLAQLGGAGLGLVSGIRGATQLGGQTKLAEQAAKRQADLAAMAQQQSGALAGFSQAQLAGAQQGKIPPAVQAQIDQWAQAAKQRVMDLAARTGQGSSSQLQSWLSWIDQQAQAMQAQALNDMISQGISAGGTAGGVLGAGAAAAGGAGQTAAGQQQGLEQLIAAANQALARLG